MRPPNEAETLLAIHMKEVFPTCKIEAEYRFHPSRKWRFDLATVCCMVAVECNGGIWSRGRHSRGAGLQSDYDKLNSATSHGWTVFQFSTEDIMSGRDVQFLKDFVSIRKQRRAEMMRK